MTDRELMQMALDALEWCYDVTEWPANGKTAQDKAIEALRARLSQCDRCGEVNPAEIHTCTPKQEPVAWVAYENGEKHGIDFDEDEIAELPIGTMLYAAPPHFLDPAKVARLMDEAFERGKKEIDMEQVKDIAQKLADCALLNSAPPQREDGCAGCGKKASEGWALYCVKCSEPVREWQGLTDEEIEKLYLGSFDEGQFARAIEAKLKEKNNG